MTPFEKAACAHAQSRAASGTRWLYEHDLWIWLAFCTEHGIDPSAPTLKAATDFRERLLSNQKPLTVRRTLSSLSSMYEAARELENPLATWNPFKKLPRPSADLYSRTEAISDTEAQAILKSASGEPRDYAILRLLYDTGLRRASVAALERGEMIRRGNQTIARVIVKGGKRREVELPDVTARAVSLWLSSADISPWVFPAGRSEWHIHPSAINKIVTHYGRRAGVVHAHPHRFRASFATAAIDAGLALHEVQASLHHASPTTTQRYDRGQRGVGISDAVTKFRKEKNDVDK